MKGYLVRGVLVAGAALMATACTSYPTEPRYSTRVDGGPYAAQPGYPTQPSAPLPPAEPFEAPPPLTAPIGSIEGGALRPTSPGGALPPATSPSYPAAAQTPPSTPVTAGSSYVIQPGDTISGVGRRFRTPVQTLIDLNALGPQGSIRAGQSILLPGAAVDTGYDPYATGPGPVVLSAPVSGPVSAPVSPPAPPPPRPTTPQAAVSPPRVTPVPAIPAPPPPSTSGAPGFQWPVRGEILRRFGPIGLGERNNGINIGAASGSVVVAAAAGRAAYVGDALPGLGLTVIIMHRDGWRTVYSHLGSATVDDGDDVRAGQQIGTVGTTAGDGRPSIHFETRRMQGDTPTAVDPLTVLPR